ncbi:MAG: flagellar filament capping protein FliD, partial [Sulfurimonas sp.]|nr:flagellar filament capping protein FliD [Sulfurimonas sp.]
ILDQLREADDAQYVTPLDLSLADKDDQKNALKTIDASMTNLVDSINALKDTSLFSERSTSVTGTSVDVTAAINSDEQSFTLDVVNLATKQIEQSASFGSNTDTIATAAGSMNLNIDGLDFTIDYTNTTTLDDLKNSINDIAGDKVDATVVQIASGQYSLFISSVDTGTTQNITMTDNDLATPTLDAKLTTGMTAIQTGIDANFKFNGQDVTRTSNNVTDLIVGLDITLKEVGVTEVSIKQDNENILEKIDSFVAKFNETITELNSMTKSSLDNESRGIFSSDSTVRGMQDSIVSMITNTTSGSIFDFGFDLDKDGKLSVDKTVLGEALENNNSNVKAFFAGGTYTNADSSTVELEGAFVEFSAQVEVYTKYNAILDQMKTSITDSVSSLEEQKTDMIERLDSKYDTMQKRFIAYDIMMSRLNSASSMFAQMISTNDDS